MVSDRGEDRKRGGSIWVAKSGRPHCPPYDGGPTSTVWPMAGGVKAS